MQTSNRFAVLEEESPIQRPDPAEGDMSDSSGSTASLSTLSDFDEETDALGTMMVRAQYLYAELFNPKMNKVYRACRKCQITNFQGSALHALFTSTVRDNKRPHPTPNTSLFDVIQAVRNFLVHGQQSIWVTQGKDGRRTSRERIFLHIRKFSPTLIQRICTVMACVTSGDEEELVEILTANTMGLSVKPLKVPDDNAPCRAEDNQDDWDIQYAQTI